MMPLTDVVLPNLGWVWNKRIFGKITPSTMFHQYSTINQLRPGPKEAFNWLFSCSRKSYLDQWTQKLLRSFFLVVSWVHTHSRSLRFVSKTMPIAPRKCLYVCRSYQNAYFLWIFRVFGLEKESCNPCCRLYHILFFLDGSKEVGEFAFCKGFLTGFLSSRKMQIFSHNFSHIDNAKMYVYALTAPRKTTPRGI